MATYGGGTRINAAVSATATASTVGSQNVYATLYTCPANSYAVVWVRADLNHTVSGASYGSAHYIYVGGQHIAVTSVSTSVAVSGVVSVGNTTITSSNSANTAISVFQVYVGPGQSVQVRTDNNSVGAGATTTGYVQGVEFVNA